MKKYLVPAGLAVIACAVTAFAAGLVVRAPVLQVGQSAAGALTCSSRADVAAWGYNDHLDGGPISLVRVQLDDDHTCDGHRLYVTPLDEDGDPVSGAGSVVIGPASLHTPPFAGPDHKVYDVDLPGGGPSGTLVHGVRIAIDQGHAILDWAPPAP